ncbi:hypothetical protein [Terricaulis sp.]|uniref:hypothetical protein n=1 Tax=Terricaulis sp. TaxID=2768686 RepID=UPI002AC48740|nr:hypothetical protein [Terricaulis sp.]MDZ4693417.1 hypothetical protein [Terricaulis sp.]
MSASAVTLIAPVAIARRKTGFGSAAAGRRLTVTVAEGQARHLETVAADLNIPVAALARTLIAEGLKRVA